MPESAHRCDLVSTSSTLSRAERWSALGLGGATVLLTGLPAAGKSTIATALERRLINQGRAAYLLDGDALRLGLSSDLGFSATERSEHLRRTGQVAHLLADAGLVAVVAVISPLAADRAQMRANHTAAGLTFVEVFVDTPVSECERRDPKGLYARARAGRIANFTGVGAPYEAPESPDVHLRTSELAVEQSVDQILSALAT